MQNRNSVVLIGVDGSKEAVEAFDWYVDHLHKKGNKLIVAHAMDVPTMPTRDSWDKQMMAGSKKRDEVSDLYLKKFAEFGVDGEFQAEAEKPGEYICSVAKKHNATLVIMGTRGLGSIRRTIMGSVSDYVVHHCHCPVLVYRKK